MKIRNKITLVFILLVGSLLLSVFLLVYYFSYRYTVTDFYQRLQQRANIVAQSYLEKDEVSGQVYEEILKKHWQVLPDEQEYIFQVNIGKRIVLKKDSKSTFPTLFFEEIFSKEQAQLQTGEVFHTGILYKDNEGDFIVVVSAKDNYGQGRISYLRNILLITFTGGLLVIYFVGRYYAGKVLNPIAGITQKANEITASNLYLRLDTSKNKDELTELANTINDMLDRLETSFEIQTNFVNNASHELRNPLAVILGETEITLKKDRSIKEYKVALHAVEKEAQRLELLVNSLLKLAQTGNDGKGLLVEAIRMDELLMDVKESIDTTNPDNSIILDFSSLPDDETTLVVKGNYGLLKVALINVTDNACKFSANAEVNVAIRTRENQVEVSILDKGLGIPPEELKNISEPFYRATNVRGVNGFGVGLSLSQRIIKLHKGKIIITSEITKGTEVKIALPS